MSKYHATTKCFISLSSREIMNHFVVQMSLSILVAAWLCCSFAVNTSSLETRNNQKIKSLMASLWVRYLCHRKAGKKPRKQRQVLRPY